MKKVLFQEVDRFQFHCPINSFVDVKEGTMDEMCQEVLVKIGATWSLDDMKQGKYNQHNNCVCFFGNETDYVFTVID